MHKAHASITRAIAHCSLLAAVTLETMIEATLERGAPLIILDVWPPDWISIQINKAVFLRAVNQIALIHQIQEVTSTVSELTVN